MMFLNFNHWYKNCFFIRFIVFNATFHNISVISWQSVLLLGETEVTSEYHRPVASHWQILSHIVVSRPHRHEWHCNSNRKYIWLSLQYKYSIYLTVITIQIYHISDYHYNTNITYIWLSLQYKYIIYLTVITIQIYHISDFHYNTNIAYILLSLQYKYNIYLPVITIQIYHISDCHCNTNIPYI